MQLFSRSCFSILNILILVIAASPYLSSQNKLQTRINAAVASKDFKYASLGVAVIDIESGKTLAGINENKVLVPASSQKLITTFAALDILGEDYIFTTEIAYDGRIQADGTLEGNIYIIGGGDPTLGSSIFKNVLPFEDLIKDIGKRIKDFGITCIDGKIIADETFFHSFPVSPSWQWNDLGNYYAAGAWGLNINENSYLIAFDGREVVGLRPNLKYYSPKIPDIEFSNEIVVDSAGTGDNAYIFGGPNNYYKRIVGTIPAGKGNFYIKGSLPDPPLFTAYHVRRGLKKIKIPSTGYESLFDPEKAKRLRRKKMFEIHSPPLSDIARKANLSSNNLYCESLLKTIAQRKGHIGSGSHGIYEINKFLRRMKVDTRGIHLEDGSGLSVRNNISPKAIAHFLYKMTTKKDIKDLCRLLAVGGRNGTVAGMFKGSPAAGRVFVKSGSMNRILSFTGYIKSKSGRWVSFSIMVNGFDQKAKIMRGKLEKIMTNIYLYS